VLESGMASGESMIMGRRFGSEVFGLGGRGGGEHGGRGGGEGGREDVVVLEPFVGDVGGSDGTIFSGLRCSIGKQLNSEDDLGGISHSAR
jgi:hypothetical protein